MSSNATANYECVLNSFWLLNTSYKACLRSDVHSVMCLWISDWQVVLMILSHVRGKNLKVQTHTWGTPRIINFLDKSETVRTFANNRSKHINNDVFARQKIHLSPFKMSLNSEVESLKCTWMSLKFVLTKPYEPCTYEDARTQVKTSIGITGNITVRVGLHQGSSLSPYLFDMILHVMGRGIKEQPPPPLVYAVCRRYIVLCSTRIEHVERKLEQWKGKDWRLVERRLNTWGAMNMTITRRDSN